MTELVEGVDPRIWTALPAVKDGYGYLYVIRFSSDVVKVGKTIDPTMRIKQHINESAAYQVKLVEVWFSAAHPQYAQNESTALDALSRQHLGKRARREYFHGVDFGTVVDLVKGVCSGDVVRPQLELLVNDDPVPTSGPIPPSVLNLAGPLAWRAMADHLKQEIDGASLDADAVGPSLEDLQERYGVSAPVARRAVEALRMQGVTSGIPEIATGYSLQPDDERAPSLADFVRLNKESAEIQTGMIRLTGSIVTLLADQQAVIDDMSARIAHLTEMLAERDSKVEHKPAAA